MQPPQTASTRRDGYFSCSGPDSEQAVRDAIHHFHDKGYAIFLNHASVTETTALRHAAAQILADFSHHSESHASVFTTVDQTRKMDDSYFLSSATNISCFLEDNHQTNSAKPVNKIGHALHELDPTFRAFSRSEKVRSLARAVGLNAPKLVQSMYILKNPRIGGEVRPHRDGTFVRGMPCPSGVCLGYWWALEHATLQNACLWAVPGSHRDGRTLRNFVVDERRTKTRFQGQDDVAAYADHDFVALPMQRGDLIIIHGGLVHRSLQNTSEKSRHAYSIHVVNERLEEDCWLQHHKRAPANAL